MILALALVGNKHLACIVYQQQDMSHTRAANKYKIYIQNVTKIPIHAGNSIHFFYVEYVLILIFLKGKKVWCIYPDIIMNKKDEKMKRTKYFLLCIILFYSYYFLCSLA